MWAILGGSGFENFDGFEFVSALPRETPFGLASSGLSRVKLDGRDCLFISRHGEKHELLPSEVNYRANIWVLKKYGAKAIISLSAVGSLRIEYEPGDMVIPWQYLDRTKGIRVSTFCGDGLVGHVSLANPICLPLAFAAKELSASIGLKSHVGQTYVCIEGPYFSTKADSRCFRLQGADIIGMTHFPEFALAKEAGISYLPCCFVTDYDCWDDEIPHVTLEEVIVTMRENNGKAFRMTQEILSQGDLILKECTCSQEGLNGSL
ncbi:MAG: MTAP family purine nucleoside phosphorylase, partial [Bdellovibrionales bacterium]|nr:MTAP family purine nucleoside phosphorylase [Bdellovibrionales bacterium]